MLIAKYYISRVTYFIWGNQTKVFMIPNSKLKCIPGSKGDTSVSMWWDAG